MQTDTDLRSSRSRKRQPGLFLEWGDVPLRHEVFRGENAIEVVAGTNVPRGGSSKHGGRTILVLHDAGGTTIEAARVMINAEENSKAHGVMLVLGGDSEARTLADALEFAAQTIREQIQRNHAGQG